MMRVLVSGAQGWLGRFTTAALLRRPGTRVLGIGRSERHESFSHRLLHGDAAPLPLGLSVDVERYAYAQCDLRETERVSRLLKDFQPSHLLHLAGAVAGSSPEMLEDLNVLASESLLEAVAGLESRPRIIMASSGSIYGEPVYLPQDELHPVEPVTSYSRSKWKAEQAAAVLADRTGLRILFARIFNLVGPGAPISLLPGALAAQLAAAAHGLQEPRIRMGPLTAVRDYVDVRDCGAALDHLIRSGESTTEVVNISSGLGTSMKEVWERLRGLAHQRSALRAEVDPLPPLPPNSSTLIGDPRRLAGLGFRCATPLAQSLADLYDWALLATEQSRSRPSSPARPDAKLRATGKSPCPR